MDPTMSTYDFAGSARPSLGVELELQVLDPATLALDGSAAAVLDAVPAPYRRAIKPEFYDCCVEVATGVCRDVAAAGRGLQDKIEMAASAASRCGVLLGWGGAHPFSHWAERRIAPTPRYQELQRRYRGTLHRQLTFGLHVHVGVPDGDAAVRACRRIGEHLPALLALSANSPFWCGRCTGLHSQRIEVMDASPSSGPPPRLGGWGDYSRFVERLVSTGLIGSAKELWWDARPSPENGTVEVRICDMPPGPDAALTLAALIQCLVVELSGDRSDDPAEDACASTVARLNRWRAARHGMAAEFVDARTGRLTPAADAVRRLVDRLHGVASGLHCEGRLARAVESAKGPDGAERQLAAYEDSGDLRDVVRRCMLPVCRPPLAVVPAPPPGREATHDVPAARLTG